jgi:hypothetical protein
MTTLGKPGWFTPPSEITADSNDLFGYLFGKCQMPKVPRDAELACHGDSSVAQNEFMTCVYIVEWDNALGDIDKTLDSASSILP